MRMTPATLGGPTASRLVAPVTLLSGRPRPASLGATVPSGRPSGRDEEWGGSARRTRRSSSSLGLAFGKERLNRTVSRTKAVSADGCDTVGGEGEGSSSDTPAWRNWQLQAGALVLALALSVWKVPALNAIAASSGFSSAFGLIFVSEIGDKTFFLAALLAAQKSKALVLAGTMAALALMSVISVAIGYVFQQLPGFFNTSVPVTEYASIVLLFLFGAQSLRDGLTTAADQTAEGELEDAKETLRAEKVEARESILSIVLSTFAIIFVAEWGDRSMFATIALVASQNPFGVAIGSIAGHLVATLLAIAGGAMVSKHLSERVLKIVGGALFIMIGIATLAGIF